MLSAILIVCAGTVLGALLGSTRACSTGGCPLTATPLRGAVYGAVLAGLVAAGSLRSEAKEKVDEQASSMVAITSVEQFEAEVIKSKIPVLVDFYADWCPPCRRLSPVLGELAGEWDGQVKFVKVNVDKNMKLAREYGVSGIPDVRFFKAGKEAQAFTGFRAKDFWEGQLKELVK